jgi:hypothetical protein
MKISRFIGSIAVLLAAFATLSACAPKNVRPLESVSSIDNFCKNGMPIGPTVMTIMSSASDTLQNTSPVSAPAVLAQVHNAGGAIAHWNDLNLLLPNTAKVLGDDGGYVHVLQAAIWNPAADVQSRTVYLLIHRKQGDAWYADEAFDLQDICVAGSRQS